MMDKQLERDLAVEARRGGRAFLLSLHDVLYPSGGPFTLLDATESAKRCDRDRAYGTYTLLSGAVIPKATVDQWARDSAAAGWATRIWPEGTLITPEGVAGA